MPKQKPVPQEYSGIAALIIYVTIGVLGLSLVMVCICTLVAVENPSSIEFWKDIGKIAFIFLIGDVFGLAFGKSK